MRFQQGSIRGDTRLVFQNNRKYAMKIQKSLSLLSTVAILLMTGQSACAHEYYAKSFKVIHPWALPTDPGASSAKVYVRFEEISASDTLIGAQTSLAERVELISTLNKGADSASSQITRVALPAGETVDLIPDGTYLLLSNLHTPLQWERSYPMTLLFEKSGPIEVVISIGAH